MSEEKKPQSLADFEALRKQYEAQESKGTYKVSGMCSNCGHGYTHEFPKGTKVYPKPCPRCGC